MKIYTKVVLQWQGESLVRVEEESFEYDGPLDLMKGGSDSADQRYANLDKLYGIQADQASFLGDTFKGTVAPSYSSWLQEAKGYGSQANQEQQASRAQADAAATTSNARQSLTDNLASMGIDPSDERYAHQMRGLEVQGMGSQAAAATGARDQVRQQGFARQQDAIGMGMGTPTQASSAANSATNAASTAMQGYNMQQQQQGNSIGNIIRGGVSIYGAYNSPNGGYADGGPVLRLKDGGYVQKLAAGGLTGKGGFMGSPQISAPPPMAPGGAAPSPTASAVQAGTQGLGLAGMRNVAGQGIEAGGKAFGSTQATAFGQGMQLGPKAAQPAIDAYKAAAAKQVDASLGVTDASDATSTFAQNGVLQPAAETEALSAGSTAAGAGEAAAGAGAGEAAAAAGAGEAAAGLGAGAALGAAVPVLGAGLALYGIGNAAGWWADGGSVTPGSNGAQGGGVSGPGGPKDDLITAHLSDGEYVMPVGAVKFFGLDKLDKMKQKGLEYEKQLGITKH